MTSAQARERTRAALQAQRALLGEPSGDPPHGDPAHGRQHDDAAVLRRACADAVLRGLARGIEPDPAAVREAVRETLDRMAAAAPGKSVEVRVPPHAAAQCVRGPRHTRGTPPNVVETDARTWLDLVSGRVRWADAVRDGRIMASGERSDLSPYLPLTQL